MTVGRYAGAGTSSSTHGFNVGGVISSGPLQNVIDKFPFATDSNATDHGDLYVAAKYCAGASSTTHGYQFGMTNGFPANEDQIQKFAIASNTTGSDVGNLRTDKQLPGGNNQY